MCDTLTYAREKALARLLDDYYRLDNIFVPDWLQSKSMRVRAHAMSVVSGIVAEGGALLIRYATNERFMQFLVNTLCLCTLHRETL